MSAFSWQELQPKKSNSRYTANSFEFHRTRMDWEDTPCVDGYIWMPPSNFSEFLSDRADRLVIVEDVRYEVHDTRNGDVYECDYDKPDAIALAQRIFNTADAGFKHELARELDLDLREASVNYWSQMMVIKWGSTTLKFSKPSSWELYSGYDRVGSAATLEALRSDHRQVAIPRHVEVPIPVQPSTLDVPRNRITSDVLRPKKDGSSHIWASHPSMLFERADTKLQPLPRIHGHAWIYPLDWDDFLSDRATRVVVLETLRGMEIHSPRHGPHVESGRLYESIERLRTESGEAFRKQMERKLGLDLSGAGIDLDDDRITFEWQNGDSLSYSQRDGGWNIEDNDGDRDWFFDLDSFKEGVRARFPHLLRESTSLAR